MKIKQNDSPTDEKAIPKQFPAEPTEPLNPKLSIESPKPTKLGKPESKTPKAPIPVPKNYRAFLFWGMLQLILPTPYHTRSTPNPKPCKP